MAAPSPKPTKAASRTTIRVRVASGILVQSVTRASGAIPMGIEAIRSTRKLGFHKSAPSNVMRYVAPLVA